jgi:hypothetical protein
MFETLDALSLGRNSRPKKPVHASPMCLMIFEIALCFPDSFVQAHSPDLLNAADFSRLD